MPARRKLSQETKDKAFELFYSDLINEEIGKQLGYDFYRTIKPLWLTKFSEEQLKERFKRLCAISKTGKKNPMFGKCGKKHPRHKNKITSKGYTMIDAPRWYTGIRPKGSKVLEHIIVACIKYKITEIPDLQVVHHINFKKKDNRPENLEIVSRTKHAQIHYKHNLAKKVQRLSRKGVGSK